MLEGNVQIGQDQAFRHERNNFIDVWIGIDVMQSDPCIQAPKRLSQFIKPCLDRAAIPKIRSVTAIHPISAGVLGDHQEFLDTRSDQPFRLLQDLPDRTTDQVPAKGGDDAKGATMVTTL